MSLASSNQPFYNLELQTPLVAPAQSNQTVNTYRKAADDDLSPTSEDSEPTMRIFSKAANPRDPKQHWIKDKKCTKGVKDEKGLPSFALVNKGTGEAMKHPSGHDDLSPTSEDSEPTMRIFSKAAESYSLTVMNGNVVLAPANPRDAKQHWIKDITCAKGAKDEKGLPSFALVNKGTGEAMKHCSGRGKPVHMVPFKRESLDKSILWSESHDLGDGFKCIRMANNIRLNLDAFHGDDEHGGVQRGTTVVLCETPKGKNQRWRIASY